MANDKLSWTQLRKQVAQMANCSEQEAEQFLNAFIEAILTGLKTDKQVKIKGIGTFAVKAIAPRKSVNIATGEEHSIGDLANELIAQINPAARIVCEEERLRPEKSEVERLLGDATKIKTMTGWQPQYTFEQGLAETIAWFRSNREGYKSDIYNV
mgnify:CR=1 FL=1